MKRHLSVLALAGFSITVCAGLPVNNDSNKVVAIVSSCDFRTETCGVTINGKEDYIPYGDLSEFIPMYKGSLKDPVYCDGPICYKAFLETDAIGLNPEFDWSSVSPSKPEKPAQQASEESEMDTHDYTSQVNSVLSMNGCKSDLGGDVAFEIFKLEANRIGIRQALSTRTQQYGMPGSYSVFPISSNGVKCSRSTITSSKSLPGASGVNYTDAVYQCNGRTPFIVIKIGRSIPGTANGFRSECKVIGMQ